MRQLEKLALGIMGTAKYGRPVRLDYLPLSSLRVDDKYQRDVGMPGEKHVRRIAAKFNWSKFSPVIVTFSGEANCYAIIDGQHRSMAALALGFTKVPCAIVEADAAEAAAIFAAVNGEVRRMHTSQVFKAAFAAGEEWAVAVKAACDAAGVMPLMYPVQASKQKPFSSNAVGRMKRWQDRHGKDFLEAVLRVVVAKPHANVQGFINSAVIDDVAQSLLAQPDGVKSPLDVAARLVKGLKASVVVPVAPVAAVQDLPVVPGWHGDAEALRVRIQDMRSRGFNKSMVAASLKCRYATVESLWGAA